MRAEIGHTVFQIDGPLTTWTHALGQMSQGSVVAKLFAALLLGQGFGLLLARQVTVERDDRPAPHQYSENNANRSEEHTSELQSLMRISYAVFCLKKTTTQHTRQLS